MLAHMKLTCVYLLLCVFGLVVCKYVSYQDMGGLPYKVAYDGRSFSINGERTLIQAGEVHYARSTVGTWGNILAKARANGLNAIQTYFFWNLHEHIQGHMNFSTPDLGTFLQLAADNNLFVFLRIGPYCNAEWNYGCYPVWLGQVPGISPRSSNAQWLALMKNVFDQVFNFVTPYLAKNGGPIIISQIENEYPGTDANYLSWMASAVKNYSTFCNVWFMCQGASVYGTISTCDDCDCVEFAPTHTKQYPNQPLVNTEDHGFNQRWGWAPAYRTIEDLASGVAEWFAIGGSYHSYYMWHGGNNYGRNAASGIATEYANDVLLYSDGVPHEPKYSHLTKLHDILAWYSDVITGQAVPTPTNLQILNGTQWQVASVSAFTYGNQTGVSFIVNYLNAIVLAQFQGTNISMAPLSVSLIAANNTVLWNSNVYQNNSYNYEYVTLGIPLQWSYWLEPLNGTQSTDLPVPVITSFVPLEQLNITQDESIYLWYRTNITIPPSTNTCNLTFVGRKANAYLVYINGTLLGTSQDYTHAQGNVTILLQFNTARFSGTYVLGILSISLGIDSGGKIESKGIVSAVKFNGVEIDNWSHQKGTVGEYYGIFAEGASLFPWSANWTEAHNRSAAWFSTTFNLEGADISTYINNPLLLNVTGLTRGHAYVNGMDIGLYWTLPGLCNYVPPAYGCQQGLVPGSCGLPTQSLYHIPPDWLVSGENILTIFDDLGMTHLNYVGLVQKVVTA